MRRTVSRPLLSAGVAGGLLLSGAVGLATADDDTVVADRMQALRACETKLGDKLTPRVRVTLPTDGGVYQADCPGGDPLGNSYEFHLNVPRNLIALALGPGDPERYRIDSATAERVSKDGDFRFSSDADHVEAFAECSSGPLGPGRTNSFRIHLILKEVMNSARLADTGRLCAASVLPPGSP